MQTKTPRRLIDIGNPTKTSKMERITEIISDRKNFHLKLFLWDRNTLVPWDKKDNTTVIYVILK